jgi:hypothetical protein
MSEQRPDRCPICGEPNDCGMAAGKSECWCASVKISPEALEKVPEGAKGKVCLCRKCGDRSGQTILPSSASVGAAGKRR